MTVAELDEFAGCAVISSYVEWFERNYEAYIEDKKRRLGPDAEVPRRIKYRKAER